MSEIFNFVMGVSATILGGVVCTFLVFLTTIKEEIWGEIYEKCDFGNDK